jgi:uncharacterized protein (DUF1501 family)
MKRLGNGSRSRRSFLRGCGLTLTGVGVASLLPTPFIQHALAGAGSSNRRLMFIFLRGGNDGINTLIPHGDADYSAANRSTLYISPTEAIDLNGFASFHPALQDVMDVYNGNDLAMVHRVGYANNSRSHFDGQRIWENGDPTQTQLFEGWLFRYIQENAIAAGVDLPVLTAQPLPPLLVKGPGDGYVNVANPDNFGYIIGDPKRAKMRDHWSERYHDLLGLEPYRPILSQTGVKLFDTMDEYESWDQANWDPKDPVSGWSLFPVDFASNPDDPSAPGGKKFTAAAYPFFQSLKINALSLLESDGMSNNGTRIAGTQLGSFDTHNNQGQAAGSQANLLSWLAYGLRSLRVVLSGAAMDNRNYPAIWDDTLVTTLSEFGRTSSENGSGGTDHAAANCLFLAGGNVNGGVYNCDNQTWPSGAMYADSGRYLQLRTDYRSIFWEVLRDHMGADTAGVEAIFPGYTAGNLGAQELGLVTSPTS